MLIGNLLQGVWNSNRVGHLPDGGGLAISNRNVLPCAMLIGNLLQGVDGIQLELPTYLMGVVWLFQIELFLFPCL